MQRYALSILWVLMYFPVFSQVNKILNKDSFPVNPYSYLKEKVHKAYSLNSQLPELAPVSLIRNPINLQKAEIDYNTVNNNLGSTPQPLSHYGQFEMTTNWSVVGVPFTIVVNNQTLIDIDNNNFSNSSLHFDRNIYIDRIKSKLKGKLDPDKLGSNLTDYPTSLLKKSAEEFIAKDLKDLNKKFGNALEGKIGELGDLSQLFGKDILVLRQKLMDSKYISSLREKERLLSELLSRNNNGQPVNIEEIKLLTEEVKRMKGVDELLTTVINHKNKWQNSGLINKLVQADIASKKQLEQLMHDPETIIRLAKENFSLNTFQRFFLKISKLNIGQNTLSSSNLSVQHLLNKGINTEFLNNNRYLMLGVGKLKSINSIWEQGMANTLNANDGMMKMASIGLGSQTSKKSRLSIMSFDQSMNEFSGLSLNKIFRTSLVTTISNEITIGKGSLSTEVSRSATNYSNVITSDSGLQGKSSLQRILDSDDLLRNMAFSVRYDNELSDIDLSYGIRISKTANGYVNPGNTLLNSGTKELGFKLKKSFLKKTIQASFRSDVREYNYGTDNSSLWRNFSAVFDLKWKFRMGQSLSLKYIPTNMTRIVDGRKGLITSINRFSLDGNFSKRILGTYYRNNISIAYLKNLIDMESGPQLNKSFTLASFQNIVVGQKLIFFNINYDRALNTSGYFYFNSSFLSEIGSTYMLFNKVNVSSSVSYNSVHEWYRQLGVKQTISCELNDQFWINAYVDVRKNLVNYQPLQYGLTRIDVSLHYSIKR